METEYTHDDSVFLFKLSDGSTIVARCRNLENDPENFILEFPMRIVETFHYNGMKQYLFPWIHGSAEQAVPLCTMDILAILPASSELINRYSLTLMSYLIHTIGFDRPSEEETLQQYLSRQNRFNN